MGDQDQERRLVERIILTPPLRGRLHDRDVALLDVGISGARLRHADPIPDAHSSTLTFEWGEEEFAVDCTIVRSDVEPALGAAPANIFESGVQFTRPSEQMKLRKMLDALADREEIEHLKTLVEASKLINSSIEPDALFASILTVARKELDVERGTLYFVDEARREIWTKVAEQSEEIRRPFGVGLAATVAATGQHVILHDAYADPRFDRSQDQRSGYRTRSMLCVPIHNRQGKIVGVLQLLNKTVGSFGEKDLRFLAAISDHMAIAMENAKLHLDLIEKNRMERELQLGREIQSRLFPVPPVDVRDTAIAAMSLPCYEVGGDYYDFIELPDGDLGLAIGDVSGKGVAAALIMSSVQAALRVAAPIEPDLPKLVMRLNALLFRMARGRKYVTFFFGRYNPESGELRYVNAGHNPPFVCTPDGVMSLSATGKPIGLIPDVTYEQRTVVLEPGVTLLLYTDGLNEATNRDDHEFGMDRLASLVSNAGALPIDHIPTHVLDAVTTFENGAHATDDKTIVVLRRTIDER